MSKDTTTPNLACPIITLRYYTYEHILDSRRWCFTWNNPDGLLNLEDFERWGAKYLIFQEEIGESGTQHLQGYIEMPKPVKFSKFKLPKEVHWEPAMGTADQCTAYCSKEESRVSGPYIFGKQSKGTGERADLNKLRDAVISGMEDKDIFMDDNLNKVAGKYLKYMDRIRSTFQQPFKRDKVKVTLHYGPAGTGKTRCAFSEDAYLYDGNNGFWNQYNGETKVIFDEFGGHTMPPLVFQRVCDRYPFTANTKGGSMQFKGTDIHVCSNYLPFQWWKEGTKFNGGAIYRRINTVHYHYQKGEEPTIFTTKPPQDGLTPQEELAGYALSQLEVHLQEIQQHPEQLNPPYIPPNYISENDKIATNNFNTKYRKSQ